MKIFAIIPAINEFETLFQVVLKTAAVVDQVIVVDDGSREPLERHMGQLSNVTYLRHRINLGKGAAMKTGTLWSLKQGAEIIVFLDADGQHEPEVIPELVAPLIGRQADVVFGVRKFSRSMPFVARLGNRFLTRAISLLFRIWVTDTQSGFRAFRTAVYDQLAWESPRYAVETEMIVNAGKHHLRWREIPISTIYLDSYRGTTVLDGIRIFITMLLWRLR